MNLDALIHHYLGDEDPASLDDAEMTAVIERIAIDFGVERDAGRRFALWALMHVLGRPPVIDVAFKTPRERDAARAFAGMMARAEAAGG